MHSAEHEHLELQHRNKARPPTLARIAAIERLDQGRAKRCKIHDFGQSLKRIAFRRQFLQLILDLLETALPVHAVGPPILHSTES